MKLTQIILEGRNKPKAVIMAGSAGAGKSYLLNQLDLGSLNQINPDKYVEDPEHPAYNNLGAGVRQADKEAINLSTNKQSFVWDTTASNPKKVKELIAKGYDIYMVMVYTHPMISYINNFSRKRNVPSVAVFSTWRNVYQLIGEYDKMLNGNLSIFVNDRGDKYKLEVAAFDTAAKSGPAGIKDYLQNYNEKNGVGGSTFFKPVIMSNQEKEEFEKATDGLDYDKGNRSEDKAIKVAFLKAYEKNGVGPGTDKLRDVKNKYRDRKQKSDATQSEVMDNIADMIYSPKFQEKLKHSTPKEIDQKVQVFLT